jgi:hypothetical protein
MNWPCGNCACLAWHFKTNVKIFWIRRLFSVCWPNINISNIHDPLRSCISVTLPTIFRFSETLTVKLRRWCGAFWLFWGIRPVVLNSSLRSATESDVLMQVGQLFPWEWGGRVVGLATYLRLVPRSEDAWSCSSIPPMRLHGVVIGWARG